jgi:TPR repeat protein
MQAAADKGDANAQALLQLRRAAAAGDPRAQFEYGIRLMRDGTTENKKLAMGYLQMAKDNGIFKPLPRTKDIQALADCGDEDARALLTFSSEDGNDPKVLHLYSDFFYDDGLFCDMKIAAEYMKKAADAGDIDAQFRYSKYLYYGRGVEKNHDLARKYLKKAQAGGVILCGWWKEFVNEGGR